MELLFTSYRFRY